MTTVQRLAHLILHVGARLRAAISTALEPHGLTLPKYEALASRVGTGPDPAGNAGTASTSPAVTDTLVRDLEPRGLDDSTHDESEQRPLSIRPTDAGTRIERAATRAVDQLLQHLLDGLTPDEHDHLAAALEHCDDALGSLAGASANTARAEELSGRP